MPVAPEYLHLVYPDEIFNAYLYGRNSRDLNKADSNRRGRSVGDQVDEGRELCDRHGWPVVGVFDQDVDRSASRHAKRARDDFDAMLEGIKARQCRIVVAWEASRYYRDLEVYVRLRNACLTAGVLLCYNGVVYDLSKREDRKATAQDAVQAEDEAELIRDRNLRTQRKLASKGRPSGRTPYGYIRRYDPDTGDLIEQVPHPVRAAYVVAMFQRFAAGETTYSLAKWLNGKPDAAAPTGTEWDQGGVVLQLRNPAYIGQRVHQGQVIGPANWEPVLKTADGEPDEVTFQQVQAILNNPDRRTQRDTRVRHLLSSIAWCGEHPEEPTRLRSGKRNKSRAYYCPTHFDTVMRADRFDAYVEEGVLRWLGSDAAAAAFRRDSVDADADLARARAGQLTAQLDEARAMAGDFGVDGRPRLSVASLAALEARLTPLIEAEEAKVHGALTGAVSPLLRRLVGRPDVEAVWGDLLLPQQRAVLRQVVTIRLHKAHVKGAQKITPGRITLAFVGQPGFTAG